MSVRRHRIAAATILAVGIASLLTWTHSMARESAKARSIRRELQGVWVASLAEEGEHLKLEGKAAEGCRVVFDGHNVAFQRLIGGTSARGTYFFDESKTPSKVDFKLDEGWIIGIFALEGGTLKLCLNAFSLPERLGVPTRPQPREFRSGNGRHLYRFEKVATGT